VVVGTVGGAVPVEVLAAARAEVVPIVGVPGAATPLADRFVERMIGERARSQLQRLLDGTYPGLDLLLLSSEGDALVRLFHTLREIRRLEGLHAVPPAHLVDVQHTASPATEAWNRASIRGLCELLGVGAAALRDGIRRCNDDRRAAYESRPQVSAGARRVLVTGSEHRETRLAQAILEAGGVVVDPPPILADGSDDPVAVVARRYEHPLLSGARASSAERARLTAAAARAAAADLVVAFYLEGDDGLRWELPELRSALDDAGLPLLTLERQPYDLDGLVIDV
jgi:hypothetical protein